jgi:hypothetical protein
VLNHLENRGTCYGHVEEFLAYRVYAIEIHSPLHCGHIDRVGRRSLAVTGHVRQPREVCILVHEASRLPRLQQTNFLQPLLQFQWALK